MSDTFEFYNNECPWYYFGTSFKTLLGACEIVFGSFGMVLNGWLLATFLHSHLLTLRSHILVLNLCTASFARNLLGFPFASSSAFAKRWLFGEQSCQLYAFINQFLGVFQIVAMFSISLERYYLAKCYKNHQQLCLLFYWLMIAVCWLWSLTLSVPPFLGYGTYTCDATGTTCSYLWPAPSSGSKELGFAGLFVLFGGIVPVFNILYFLSRTLPLEKRLYRNEQQREQRRLTKTVFTAILTSMVVWIPGAVLVAWQWVPLLLQPLHLPMPSTLVLIAAVLAQAATSVPVLCYLLLDERLRAALLGRMKRNYAMLRPDRAKKYHKV